MRVKNTTYIDRPSIHTEWVDDTLTLYVNHFATISLTRKEILGSIEQLTRLAFIIESIKQDEDVEQQKRGDTR